jgi:hypothetical protein
MAHAGNLNFNKFYIKIDGKLLAKRIPLISGTFYPSTYQIPPEMISNYLLYLLYAVTNEWPKVYRKPQDI